MPANKPVFILGVGAQKAGTTFLYQALHAHPEVVLSDPKEMHVFDAYFLPDTLPPHERGLQDELAQILQKDAALLTPAERARANRLFRLCSMRYDLKEYVRYFETIVRRKGVRYTGDITPAYQLLNQEQFTAVRALLEPRFDVRVIFLMRDPIARIFSALRMTDRDAEGKSRGAPAHKRFARAFKQARTVGRTRYEDTVRALEAAFGPSQVHYELYEELFQPEAFDRIGKFLGLSGQAPDYDEKINASPATGKLAEEDIARAREFYAPTYDFCMQRFGEKRVRRLWKYC